MKYRASDISNAVAAITPDIQERVLSFSKAGERKLWWELSSCILSSQVPYSLAISAANSIDEKGLLLGHSDSNILVDRLVDLLSAPLVVEGRPRRYRFPVVRAHHLAAAHFKIMKGRGTLRNLLDSFSSPEEARSWLVNHLPGIGPKQASMFLRNAGVSYDLAILDRHVLSYMSILGIYSGAKDFISGVKQYRQYEDLLREHAQELDCPVGLIDWAIWIVMRVANRNMEPVAV